MKKRLFLTFNHMAINTPILSTLPIRFGIMFNIFGATVNDQTQFVAIEVDGDDEKVMAAIGYLHELGVRVETSPDGQA